jgi:hypothetical protein
MRQTGQSFSNDNESGHAKLKFPPLFFWLKEHKSNKKLVSTKPLSTQFMIMKRRGCRWTLYLERGRAAAAD